MESKEEEGRGGDEWCRVTVKKREKKKDDQGRTSINALPVC